MASTFTIIAATNFSETANNAVLYVAGLAKSAGAELLLFNSFSLSVHSANSHITGEAFQQQIEKQTKKIEKLGLELAEQFGIEVKTSCTYSFVEDQLQFLIEDSKAELVVMGMAERSFEQDLLGNTTTAVIKNLNIPVLAVPLKARFVDTKKILYASDTLSLSSIKRFSWLRKMVGAIGLEIEFFSVDEKVNAIKEDQSQFLLSSEADFDIDKVKYIYKSVRSNAVIDEIYKEIKAYGADILVRVPQKYGFWDSLVHKSKTRIMAAGLDIPLLSYPL